jgi:hypothetical protein
MIEQSNNRTKVLGCQDVNVAGVRGKMALKRELRVGAAECVRLSHY